MPTIPDLMSRSYRALMAWTISLLLISGCAGVVHGKAVSPIYGPGTAGGLPLNNGTSGVRADAPAPTMQVHNGDGGDVDKMAALAVEDIEEYWRGNFSHTLPGKDKAVEDLYSYDSSQPSSPRICGDRTYELPNAFFCIPGWLIAWDRGKFLPSARKYFGDMAIPGVLAHEYGHALQVMAHLVDKKSRSALVAEQQADCFGADYLHWVAAGQSHRFSLDTGDGLNKVLAGVITTRDPAREDPDAPRAHGTALDRVSAFQLGFVSGVTACAGITAESVAARRQGLPEALQPAPSWQLRRDRPITERSVRDMADELNSYFGLTTPPTLNLGSAACTGSTSTAPVSYCPEANTVFVDLPGLQKLGEPGSEYHDLVLLQGANTSMSALASRYALAVQHRKGLPMNTTPTALRTACLTGSVDRHLGEISSPAVSLTAPDIDQAVAGLLTNGLAASDADGMTVPAGFNRISAFRIGLTSPSPDRCYAEFPAS
jgi:predicted metalloprotease